MQAPLPSTQKLSPDLYDWAHRELRRGEESTWAERAHRRGLRTSGEQEGTHCQDGLTVKMELWTGCESHGVYVEALAKL